MTLLGYIDKIIFNQLLKSVLSDLSDWSRWNNCTYFRVLTSDVGFVFWGISKYIVLPFFLVQRRYEYKHVCFVP